MESRNPDEIHPFQPNNQTDEVSLTKKHLAIGLTILIVFNSTLIVYTSLTVYHQNTVKCNIENKTLFTTIEDNAPGNRTVYNRNTCTFQYKLTFERVWISVCHLHKDIVVDIRQFINNKPSIKGIQLSVQEWNSLIDWSSVINYIVNDGHKI